MGGVVSSRRVSEPRALDGAPARPRRNQRDERQADFQAAAFGCCRRLRNRFLLLPTSSDIVDLDPRVGDVVQAAVRIFLEAPPQQPANPRRRARRQRVPVRLAFENRGERVGDGLARERDAPVSISKSTQPNAQMSVRLSMAWPRACSGLM